MITQRRTKLLLVDASDSDADLFDTFLEEAAPYEFEVVRAKTLAEATAFLETGAAGAVVDPGLPDADGLRVIERMATVSPTVALIVLSGDEDDETGVATIATEASAVTLK